MEELTILQTIIEFLATDKAGIIVTSISHFSLFVGLVYTVIHLVKMMLEPEESNGEVEKFVS